MAGRFTVTNTAPLGQRVELWSLRPNTGADSFNHAPGQYVAVGFQRFGRRSPMRCFSIVSSPDEPDLQIAMRVRGNFTNAMRHLKTGDTVYVQGPFGNFTIDPDYDRNVVMMAGGIGITPFISMLRSAAKDSPQTDITLLYSCRSAHDIPFYDELLALTRHNPRLRVIFFVSGGVEQSAPDITMLGGPITRQHLRQLTGGRFSGITYFLCGPKGFMSDLETVLHDNGVNADRIVTESFTQSSKLFSGSSMSAQSLTYVFASLLVLVGVGGIMLIDLVRSVPKLVSAQGATNAAASGSIKQPATTAASQTTSSTDQSTTSTPVSTATGTSTSTTTTPSTTQTYTTPMSSVS